MRKALSWIFRGIAVVAALLAYHIPLGVLIFSVSYLTVFLSFGPYRDAGQARLASPSD